MQKVRRAADDEYGDTGFLTIETAGSSSQSGSAPVSSPLSATAGVSGSGGVNCILHEVSRLDTLAGVAIRYGVEVADIKRLNGLSCDLQMYALKTLQIPSPGKHPPSPSFRNSHSTPWQSSGEKSPTRHQDVDLFDSFQSLKLSSSLERKVSPAMSSLQGYYGTGQSDRKSTPEELEMATYHNGRARQFQDEPTASSSYLSYLPLSHYRKSRSVASSLMSANGSLHDSLLSPGDETNSGTDKWIDKLLRRNLKSESDFASYPPEKLLKEEMSGGSTISTITGKGLALRPKSSSRIVSTLDSEPLVSSPVPLTTMGDSHVADTSNSVRKSSSTSSLETDSGAFSSLWPTSKWIPKPDFQALSSAALPIFDSLPRAIGMKSKTALD